MIDTVYGHYTVSAAMDLNSLLFSCSVILFKKKQCGAGGGGGGWAA